MRVRVASHYTTTESHHQTYLKPQVSYNYRLTSENNILKIVLNLASNYKTTMQTLNCCGI